MAINQGDIYWVTHSDTSDIPHPYVIVQENVVNHSVVQTIAACALTSNIQRVSMPGTSCWKPGKPIYPD
jgi:mRNA interferase MazF